MAGVCCPASGGAVVVAGASAANGAGVAATGATLLLTGLSGLLVAVNSGVGSVVGDDICVNNWLLLVGKVWI